VKYGYLHHRLQGNSLLVTLLLLPAMSLLGGCITSTFPGDMQAVQPVSKTPRVGNVYLIRGWGGMFSWGIDELAGELRENGVSAHVYQHDQRDQLARTLAEKYRGVHNPEPLCIVAHSAGSDDALYIAGECAKAGVTIDLLVTLDNVDATVVPGNVRYCYNYWLPGTFGESNFLRGLPMEKDAGSHGTVININLAGEGRDLCEPNPSHITLDKDTKLRPRLVEHVLAACPDRRMANHDLAQPARLSSAPDHR